MSQGILKIIHEDLHKVIAQNEILIRQNNDNHNHLKTILKNQTLIMATIAELTAKVNELETALNAEQEQISTAIAALQTTIDELNANTSGGGTAEERQALADKLDAIVTDLKSTIPE